MLDTFQTTIKDTQRTPQNELPVVGNPGSQMHMGALQNTGVAQMPTDKNAAALVDSLSGFSNSLGNFVRAFQPKQRDIKGELEQWHAMRTNAQVMDAVRNGALPLMDTEVGKLFHGARVGQIRADEIKADINDKISKNQIRLTNEYGQPAIDPDALVTEQLKNETDVGRGKMFPSYYHAARSSADGYINDLKSRQQGEVANWNQETLKAGAMSRVNTTVDNMAKQPDIPIEEVGNQLNATQQAIGNTVLAKRNELDGYYAGRASDLASRTPNEARLSLKIFEAPRKDAKTGQPLPALKDNPLYANQYLEAQRNANTVFTKEHDDKAKESAISQAVTTLVTGKGDFNQITDIAYQNPFDKVNKNRVLKGDDIKAEAIPRAQRALMEQGNSQGRDPATVAAETGQMAYNMYIKNNVPDKASKALMDDASKVAGDPVALTDPANTARVLNAYRVYQDYNARAPGYAKGLADEKTQKYFDSVELYQKYIGLPPEQAVQRAAKVVSTPQPELTPDEKKAQATAIDGALNGWTPTVLGGDADPINKLEIRREFTRITEAIMRDREISPETATNVAKQAMKDRTVNINGRAIIADPYITAQSKPLWEARLEEIKTEYVPIIEAMNKASGKWFADLRSSSLTVVPIGRNTGNYSVQYYNSGSQSYEPLVIPGKGPITINRDDISRMEADKTQQIGIDSQNKANDRAITQKRAEQTKNDNGPTADWYGGLGDQVRQQTERRKTFRQQ